MTVRVFLLLFYIVGVIMTRSSSSFFFNLLFQITSPDLYPVTSSVGDNSSSNDSGDIDTDVISSSSKNSQMKLGKEGNEFSVENVQKAFNDYQHQMSTTGINKIK
jgi:hypothetical protein